MESLLRIVATPIVAFGLLVGSLGVAMAQGIDTSGGGGGGGATSEDGDNDGSIGQDNE